MSHSESASRVEMYDTTLRDGAQSEGVSFSLADKIKITQILDDLGIDVIEGGYPLSNPKDEAYFDAVRNLKFKHSRIASFGMTRRRGVKPADDEGMRALVAAETPVVTIVGKTWDLHVDEVLRVSREENIDMIAESVAHCHQAGREVFYDAEHYFDGFRANSDYALKTLLAAQQAGATRFILCDTNGGSLPQHINEALSAAQMVLGPNALFGIHCHNDGGLAVANTLSAVANGAFQVQGTINGIGERCGNVDLLVVAANLQMKMGLNCLHGAESLAKLTDVSRYVYEVANLAPIRNQPFVGSSAFAHKGGMHVHAIARLARSYEHIDPTAVGNGRKVLVSELSGQSNIAELVNRKFGKSDDKALLRRVLTRVQDLENMGYVFEAAEACLELLIRTELGQRKPYWDHRYYRCVVRKQAGEAPSTEATVKTVVGGVLEQNVAEGDGPIHALDSALRKGLRGYYPQVDSLHLRDYKVRVVSGVKETAAKVRVVTDFIVLDPNGHTTRTFSTVGVSENIVDASWEALIDAVEYHLIECGAVPVATPAS
jgi:2-isopropylmalate synthase